MDRYLTVQRARSSAHVELMRRHQDEYNQILKAHLDRVGVRVTPQAKEERRAKVLAELQRICGLYEAKLPTYRELKRRLGFPHEEAVRKAVKHLEEQGLIVVRREGRASGQSNYVRVTERGRA